jgi:TRAP-type C4-dicarboxylate transport system permease small subunit
MTFRARVDKVLEFFLVVLMSTLVLDVVWQVVSRYVFGNPSSFTDELATFLLIWVGVAGAAYVKGKNEHLAIDILHTKLSPIGVLRMMMFINFLIVAFSVSIMIIGGSWLVYTRFVLGQLSAAMQVPVGYVYLVVPISGLLMTYYAIDDISHLVKQHESLKQQ